jgi:hypothetical protein
MAKNIPQVSAVILDFHELVRRTDDAIIARYKFFLAHSKKRLFPKSTVINAYRIAREPQMITIHLLDATEPANPKTTAMFSFVAPPNFSRRIIST